jgi:hypothetical protein
MKLAPFFPLLVVLSAPGVAHADVTNIMPDTSTFLLVGAGISVVATTAAATVSFGAIDVGVEATHTHVGQSYAVADLLVGGMGTVAGGVTAALVDRDDRAFVLVLTALPVSLAAHGAWGAASNGPHAWPVAVAPVAAADLAIAAYGARYLFDRDLPPTPTSRVGLAELVVMVPQLAFAVAAAATTSDPRDRGAALGLGALPLVLAVHGGWAFARGGRTDDDPNQPPRDRNVTPRVEGADIVPIFSPGFVGVVGTF